MPKPTSETHPGHMDDRGLPLIGSVWRHHSGRLYGVLLVTNDMSKRQDKFPTTVSYQGPNGLRWSKTLTDFLEKMTPDQ